MNKLFEGIDYSSFFLTFIFLAVSGNPLFISNWFYITVALSLIVYLLVKLNRISIVGYLFYIVPFLLIFIIQVFTFSNAKISSAVFVLMKIFIGFILYRIIGKKFITAFVDVLFILSIISLFFWGINSFWGYLPGFPISDISTSLVLYTEIFDPLYGFIGRNSGMFWEPGAFEGYLNLALCFLVISNEVRYRAFKAVVISATLITTYSTTGYVIFAIIVVVFLLFYSRSSIISRVILLVLFVALALFLYKTMDILQMKIQYQYTLDATEEGRLNDYIRFLPFIKEYFITGVTADTMAELGIQDSGNGFLAFMVRYGIFGVLFYFSILIVMLYRSFGGFSCIFLITVVFLTLQGESFLLYPIYLALPFIEVDKRFLNRIIL